MKHFSIIGRFHAVDEVLRSGTEGSLVARWRSSTQEMQAYYSNTVTWNLSVSQQIIPVTGSQIKDAMSKLQLNFSIDVLAEKYNQAIAKKGWTSVMPEVHYTTEPNPKKLVLPPPFSIP